MLNFQLYWKVLFFESSESSMASAAVIFSVMAIEIIVYCFHASVLILLFSKRKTPFESPFFGIFRIVFVADLVDFIAVSFAMCVQVFHVPTRLQPCWTESGWPEAPNSLAWPGPVGPLIRYKNFDLQNDNQKKAGNSWPA